LVFALALGAGIEGAWVAVIALVFGSAAVVWGLGEASSLDARRSAASQGFGAVGVGLTAGSSAISGLVAAPGVDAEVVGTGPCVVAVVVIEAASWDGLVFAEAVGRAGVNGADIAIVAV